MVNTSTFYILFHAYEILWYKYIYGLFQIFATVLAVATAIPIEDTDEVKAAKAEHAAAHAEANARVLGEAVASAYLADFPEVVEAKAAFQAVFDKYAAGEVALPVAPVHEVPAVSITILKPDFFAWLITGVNTKPQLKDEIFTNGERT